MSPKHSDPSYNAPRRDSKTGEPVWARAPYNFIRLPEKVVIVDPPPDQSVYSGHTGWVDCELVTRAPTYIRGMVTQAWLKKQDELQKAEAKRERSWQEQQRRTTPEERADIEERERKQKMEAAVFFGMNGIPFLPGSSLRGMIRSIVEIISYSKVRWVSGQPTFSFRAVAAQAGGSDPYNRDPLRESYDAILDKGKKVRAGYLHLEGNDWYIYPAKRPSEVGLPSQQAYLKVKEHVLIDCGLPGYIPLGDRKNYRPQLIEVSFQVEKRKDKNNRSYTAVTNIGPATKNLTHKGWLVCSGNMHETEKTDQGANTSGKTADYPRKKGDRYNQCIVLEKAAVKEIKISRQAVKDYQMSLTPYQQEQLIDWGGGEWGCLRDGAPIFYIWEDEQSEVVYFGHNPYFRVPLRLPETDHASNPLDFVPENLRAEELIDLADALFGWTPEPGSKRKDSCAGRVFFSDGKLVGTPDDIWYREEPIIPHVLSGPKATTFQHYLVQDSDLGHDPDRKVSLAHYGTLSSETQIRGRKYYWHRGQDPKIEASAKEREHERQLARIQPLKSGVHFRFRINFENLRDEELGALLWALRPRGEPEQTYVHKIGMGKPLGMGAVEIDTLNLHLTEREDRRYRRLFNEANSWETGEEAASAEEFQQAFEDFLLSHLEDVHPNVNKAADLPPLADLLAMMAWNGEEPGAAWLEWTRYMEIEHGADKQNEFKERPVLPSPLEVLRWAAGAPSVTQETKKQFSTDQPTKSQPGPGRQAAGTSPEARPKREPWPPEKRTILFGKVIDEKPGGNITLEITGAQDDATHRWLQRNLPSVEVTLIIQPKYLADKSIRRAFREGAENKRVVFLEAKQERNGWLLYGRPA